MSALFCLLTAVDGVQWRLSYTANFTFIVSISSGSCSLCSATVSHDISAGEKQFSLYLASAFINFPSSEFKKFKEFMQQVNSSKAAA